MRSLSRSLAPLLLLAGLLALGACGENGEEEQSLIPEKGVYAGPEDTPLTEEQINELRNRTLLQSFN